MKKLFQLINKNLFFEAIFKNVKKTASKKELPLITISREMGSGGRPIAYLAAKKLRGEWRVYHKDLIDKIAKQANLEKALIKEIDEKKLGLVDELIGNFFGKRYPSLNIYHKNLIKVLSEIGQRGYAIIVGRGADYLFPKALKVRIICLMEQRIKWEMEFEHLDRKQAIERIENSDNQRYQFIKTLYRHDIKKAHHYDLVIRTGPDLSIKDAADLIVLAAKKRFKI